MPQENQKDIEEQYIEREIKNYTHVNEIELSDEQFKEACKGVQFWLQDAINESVATAVYTAKGDFPK